MVVTKPVISFIQEIKSDIRNMKIDNKKITNELTCIRKLVELLLENQNKVIKSNSEIEKYNRSIEPIKSGWFFT
tara:strand:- start:746 stop:967 length:222 start_codon:yes stop_codon:yes gene_type:complete